MVANIEQTSFDLLGKRWTALIVKDLMGRPRRFRELLNSVGRINDKVLSQRLKELEERGIVTRQVYPEVPVRVEYALTEKGKGLAAVIHAMEQWDSAWGRGAANGGFQGAPQAASVTAEGSSTQQAALAQQSNQSTRIPFWKRFGL